MKKKTVLILFVLSLVGVACIVYWRWQQRQSVPADNVILKRLALSQYPDFSDTLLLDNLEQGISKSLAYLARVPADRLFTYGEDRYTAAHLTASCRRFLRFIDERPTASRINAFIREHYRVYQCTGGDGVGNMLMTGYYEPLLKGSPKPTAAYPYPVYSLPEDMVFADLSRFYPELKGKRLTGRLVGRNIVPYYARHEIEENGEMDAVAKPLAWVGDRIDLFFLQIQGSGAIAMPDGKLLHVHYHGTNGHPYRSIGKLLIDQNKIPREEMSMQRIRGYLEAHPDEVDAVLNYNPSYVFFKLEAEGPIGAMGEKLTPIRSIALDRDLFPMGALAYIETQIPEINPDDMIDVWLDFKGFVLNQDTGGAIKGPGRADLFWGNGRSAEIAAGHMQHEARLYFLVLDPLTGNR